MYNREYTPERITELKRNEIFVFGSNLAGAHGGGAARLAYERFGAVLGQGVGLQGQSYAIPTMQGGVETIKPYVDEFITFSQSRPDLKFYVTQIGCGIAGFKVAEIAPLFQDAIDVVNIILPKEFVDVITTDNNFNLERFIEVQKLYYEQALKEIQDGLKRSHWIWFIFPQLSILGHSWNAKYYGISGYDEAHQEIAAVDIFGDLDAMKVRSCMTLFDAVSPDDIFEQVLEIFYHGTCCKKTLDYM